MSIRPRFDKNGNKNCWYNVIFDDIPDDYMMRKILTASLLPGLSYVGIMKQLRENRISEEFEDDNYYSKEVFSHLAMDYLYSALLLQKGIAVERKNNVVSYYLTPCAYLCKHSIELKLKECLLEKYGKTEKTHSIAKLWDTLAEKEVIHYEELNLFIQELEAVDKNEMALRYGVSVNLEPLQENFMFDIDAILDNTKFFFNVVDEHIICKYRYNEK